MIIYPTIELQNQRCVSLTRGNMNEPQIWHVDPVEKAREFAAAGAEWMQITDFDAIVGSADSSDLKEEMIRSVGIPVQLAGGFRSREQVEHWIDKGAGRIVLGTLAVHEPNLVMEMAKFHPDQIVLAVDVWQGKVMTDGWKKSSAYEPLDFIQAFADAPLAAIVVTDIDADFADSDASLSLISSLAAATRHQVISRGLIRTVDDVTRLRYVSNVAGAQVGQALFRKTVDLADALAAAAAPLQKTAEFL